MVGRGGRCWLAVVAAVTWLATTVLAQPSFPLERAGGSSSGHAELSDPRRPIHARSVFGTPKLVRLPPVESAPAGRRRLVTHLPTSRHHSDDPPHASTRMRIDGTWQEDGRLLILNLDGQQFRLVKKESPSTVAMAPQDVPAEAALTGGGKVRGRLLHRGQPLVDCEVALISLQKSWLGYRRNRSAKLIVTTTNAEGDYCFAQVPPGSYKLKWRPAGETSWIRRAETRPDVFVREGETSNAKEVRVALRTIN